MKVDNQDWTAGDTTVNHQYRRSPHLKRLEAESIHIMREVAAEFDNPVMLYSIGKDSSVILLLARKACCFLPHIFLPAKDLGV